MPSAARGFRRVQLKPLLATGGPADHATQNEWPYNPVQLYAATEAGGHLFGLTVTDAARCVRREDRGSFSPGRLIITRKPPSHTRLQPLTPAPARATAKCLQCEAQMVDTGQLQRDGRRFPRRKKEVPEFQRRAIERDWECGEEGKDELGRAGSGRLGPERSRRGGAEPRAYMQIEGEIRLIRTGNTAQKRLTALILTRDLMIRPQNTIQKTPSSFK